MKCYITVMEIKHLRQRLNMPCFIVVMYAIRIIKEVKKLERSEIDARIRYARQLGLTTTVTILRTTLERLRKLCPKGESYDHFLNRVVDVWEKM